jgi:hypothetical protein
LASSVSAIIFKDPYRDEEMEMRYLPIEVSKNQICVDTYGVETHGSIHAVATRRRKLDLCANIRVMTSVSHGRLIKPLQGSTLIQDNWPSGGGEIMRKEGDRVNTELQTRSGNCSDRRAWYNSPVFSR